MMEGYIQVYTGDGKGKTTAAIGLAVRALGAGLRVCIIQFMKLGRSSEFELLSSYGSKLDLHSFGPEAFITGEPTTEDIEAAEKGLKVSHDAVMGDRYDVVILDEANMAVYFKLIELSSLLGIMESKPRNVELVITGRNAHPQVIEKADLATEMKMVKHYYEKGVKSRQGIEE
jgi:cob(I)alamin adenosyltransferase